MSFAFQVMYRLGFTPWDHDEPAEPLVDLVKELPPGALLDVGCGTGKDAIWCAAHGWQVTGVDAVSVPIKQARRRAEEAGASGRFLQADITRVAPDDLGAGFTLVQDIGCIGSLDDAGRQRAAQTLTAVSAPGARLLMFSFGPGAGQRFGGPRRIAPDAIRALYPAWDLVSQRSADEVPVGGPMRSAPRSWTVLEKR
jgi:SAM-dependent methyltransferase